MNLLLISLAIVVAAPAPKEAAKKDSPSIVGEWISETGTRGGKPQPPTGGVTMTFAADGKAQLSERGKSMGAKFQTNQKKAPAEIDIEMGAGGMKPVISGIFKIEGDILTICFVQGGQRPAKFESPEGSEVMLITLRRSKQE